MTEDLVNHVKKFELYPEGKGKLVKGFKGKSGIVCLQFGKVAQLLRASLERGETRETGWAGPRADPPRSPVFPAAAGTDVAAVRAAILWERNQRLARSSSLAAAAEGEAAGRGPGAGWRAAGACQGYATHCPLPRRKGVEGCGEDGPGGGRGEAGAVRPEAGPGTGDRGPARRPGPGVECGEGVESRPRSRLG